MKLVPIAPVLALLLAAPTWAHGPDGHHEEAAPLEAAPVEEGAVVEEAAPAGPVTYALDPAKSWLYVMVFNDNDRWTPVQGHDHGIRATTFDGTVVWDEADAAACKVEISFPVSALKVDPPGMRARAGLSEDGAIGDGAKETVEKNFASKSQLDADSFPKIVYTSTSCSGTTGKVDVVGTLGIHGVGKEVKVPMTIVLGEGSFAAKGSFTLSHSDFGMKPFTYGPATPKNQEKLVFTVDVVGSAK